MVLKVYNTLSRSVEAFRPLRDKRVRVFVCGPTVYDQSHVGHARTYLAYDIIVRYLRAKSYSVFYVVNITDIDDKIISRANASGEDPLQLADRFTKEFFRDMEALGITSVNLYPKASEHVPEIIDQIAALISKGFAYQVDGDVYFDVSKFPDYGKLSGQNIEQLSVHRIDPDSRKRNAVDFALWKNQKPGEPAWESPWGKGRPGWHIEDTAITTTYFGPQYDMHGGGQDLEFPHHEAEIAQAEAATGVKPLAKCWLHAGLLTVTGERMGKSIGNFVTIQDLLKRHDSEALRLYYAMRHYRTQLEFDEAGVVQAEEVLDKLRSVYSQFRSLLETSGASSQHDVDTHVKEVIVKARQSFEESMDDDFNTPRALAAMIAYAKDIGPYAKANLDRKSLELIMATFDYFGGIFGILRPTSSTQGKMSEQLIDLVMRLREDARRRGDWKASDEIRNQLRTIGIGLEDTSQGARWYLASTKLQSAKT
jgi:cysteinyl-tRNA synthetase